MKAAASRHGLSLNGFLIGETVRIDAEVFIGLSLDPEFGPVLTFGAGGIYTELLKDVTTRLLPLDRSEIAGMIDACRIGAILGGLRGRAAMDVAALIDLIGKITDLAPQLGPDFQGVEINPVAVGKSGIHILDATVFGTGSTA